MRWYIAFRVSTSVLDGDLVGKAVQLSGKVSVLGNVEEELAGEVGGLLDHLDAVLERGAGLGLVGGDDAVPVDDVAAALGGELDGAGLDLAEGGVDELDALGRGADGLEVAEGLADPEAGQPDTHQGLDRLLAAGHEDGVEHGRAHAVEEVVGLDRGRAVGGRDVLALGRDGEGQSGLGPGRPP